MSENVKNKYYLVNAFEDIIKDKVNVALADSEMCKCEKCFTDICAIVLNNIPCQYITSKHGELITQATQLDVSVNAQITMEIYKAINIVGQNPKHSK